MESTRTVSPADLLSAALEVDRDLRRCRDVEELLAEQASTSTAYTSTGRVGSVVTPSIRIPSLTPPGAHVR